MKENCMIGAWLRKLTGQDDGPDITALYAAVVAEARQPHWYLRGGVSDTVDGRFEMMSAVLSVVIARIEAEGEAGQFPSVRLTELFVDDMDGQLREQGVGDVVVGKHIGKMMSALGGRLAAYRDGLASGDLSGAIARNLHRGEERTAESVAHAADGMKALAARVSATPLSAVLQGQGLSA
jgi:cytochrome b pre-mRNA-processing protein 3